MATRIVVIGGGYAGMMTAIRLAGKSKRHAPHITLINPVETFVERVRLHEYALNIPLKHRSIPMLLRGTGVRFVQGSVTHLKTEAHEVVIDGKDHISYDYLVYAPGSAVNRDSTPGVRSYTHVLNPNGSAEALRDQLAALGKSGGHVLIVGGGATGIEAAAEIKGVYPQFQVGILTQGEIGGFKGERVQKHIRSALQGQGISLYEYQRVEAVQKKALVLRDHSPIPFDLCLWAGGFIAAPLAREAGLQVNEQGQILVDPFQRALSHPEIYAIGDAAQPIEQPGAPTRMSVFTALVTGAHTADNLAALLHGRTQKPLSFSWYGQAIALGPRDAVGFATFPDDKPVGPIYRGILAVRLRLFFVWFLVYSLEIERHIPGFLFWLGKGRYQRMIRSISVRPVIPSND